MLGNVEPGRWDDDVAALGLAVDALGDFPGPGVGVEAEPVVEAPAPGFDTGRFRQRAVPGDQAFAVGLLYGLAAVVQGILAAPLFLAKA